MECAMSDSKSKFPDMKELTSIGKKLFCDIKTSVEQIIQDYKEVRAKHAGSSKQEKPKTAPDSKKNKKTE